MATQPLEAEPGIDSPWRSFHAELPDDLVRELDAEFSRTGLDPGQILAASLQLYAKVRRTLRRGGTIRFETPGDPGNSFTISGIGDE